MTPDGVLDSISDAERAERLKRGLPAYHILDISEFPFLYARPTFKNFARAAKQWAAQAPSDPGAHSINAWARVLMGDYVGADEAMAHYQAGRPTDPFAQMRFAEMPAGAPAEMPAVSGEWPSEPAFFIACDPGYLQQYGLPLLHSLAHHAPGCPAHVHVMGLGVQKPSLELRLSLTSESVPINRAGRMYYHAARLVRFAQAIKASGQPLIMSDADALVTGDPRSLLAMPGDIGLRVRPGRIEPWHHFSACLVRGHPQRYRIST